MHFPDALIKQILFYVFDGSELINVWHLMRLNKQWHSLVDDDETFWRSCAERAGVTRKSRAARWKDRFLQLYLSRCPGCHRPNRQSKPFSLLPLEPKGVSVCGTCLSEAAFELISPAEAFSEFLLAETDLTCLPFLLSATGERLHLKATVAAIRDYKDQTHRALLSFLAGHSGFEEERFRNAWTTVNALDQQFPAHQLHILRQNILSKAHAATPAETKQLVTYSEGLRAFVDQIETQPASVAARCLFDQPLSLGLLPLYHLIAIGDLSEELWTRYVSVQSRIECSVLAARAQANIQRSARPNRLNQLPAELKVLIALHLGPDNLIWLFHLMRTCRDWLKTIDNEGFWQLRARQEGMLAKDEDDCWKSALLEHYSSHCRGCHVQIDKENDDDYEDFPLLPGQPSEIILCLGCCRSLRFRTVHVALAPNYWSLPAWVLSHLPTYDKLEPEECPSCGHRHLNRHLDNLEEVPVYLWQSVNDLSIARRTQQARTTELGAAFPAIATDLHPALRASLELPAKDTALASMAQSIFATRLEDVDLVDLLALIRFHKSFDTLLSDLHVACPDHYARAARDRMQLCFGSSMHWVDAICSDAVPLSLYVEHIEVMVAMEAEVQANRALQGR